MRLARGRLPAPTPHRDSERPQQQNRAGPAPPERTEGGEQPPRGHRGPLPRGLRSAQRTHGSAFAADARAERDADGPDRSRAYWSASSRSCRLSISRSSGRLRPRREPAAAMPLRPQAAPPRGGRAGPAPPAPLPQLRGSRHLTGSDGGRRGPAGAAISCWGGCAAVGLGDLSAHVQSFCDCLG